MTAAAAIARKAAAAIKYAEQGRVKLALLVQSEVDLLRAQEAEIRRLRGDIEQFKNRYFKLNELYQQSHREAAEISQIFIHTLTTQQHERQSTNRSYRNGQRPAVNAAISAATAKGIQLTNINDLGAVVDEAKSVDVENLKVGTVNLKTEYLSFETAGEVHRGIFLGFTLKMSVDPVTGEEKGFQPAAQLYDPKSESIFLCMQTVIVGVINDVRYPVGAALQITYKGEKKGKNNLKYQNFDIRALIP
jgi:hypothetical protein